MNRNQYDQDERMHRGIGRERELERLRNQLFQGQLSRSQRLQDLEAGYAGSGGQMDEDFDERYGNRAQSGRYPSGGGGYGGMERQWQSPSQEFIASHDRYGQGGYGPSQYGQSSGQSQYGPSPYGQSQFNQGWSDQYGNYMGPQGPYGQQYGQQGLYGQQGSSMQPGQYGQQGFQGGSQRDNVYGQQGSYGGSQGISGSQQGLYGSQGQRGLHGQESFRGRGPKGYTRPDERIKEEICERLTRHPEIDASDIEIEARQGVITLTGSVDHRSLKHLVEDLVENVSGVKDIENRIAVKSQSQLAQSGSSGRAGQQGGVSGGMSGQETKPRH